LSGNDDEKDEQKECFVSSKLINFDAKLGCFVSHFSESWLLFFLSFIEVLRNFSRIVCREGLAKADGSKKLVSARRRVEEIN